MVPLLHQLILLLIRLRLCFLCAGFCTAFIFQLCKMRVHTGTPPYAVAVPTHYFKVLLAEFSDEKGEKRLAVGAFAMPNRKIAADTPLASFAVPLELLESLTGIEFFPRAVTDSQRRALDAAAAGLSRSLYDFLVPCSALFLWCFCCARRIL